MSLSEIHNQLIDYFKLDAGAYISDHQNLINLFDNYFVTKRSLKHIVEQRRKDNYDTNKTKDLFTDLHDIIQEKIFILTDNNKDTTKILIETRADRTVLAVAIVDKVEDKNIIVTAFYRSKKKLTKYLKNK